MISRILAAGVFSLMASTAAAATWTSGENNRGAWARIQQGDLFLNIACNPNEAQFFFTLTGGPFNGMKNIDDGTESMMMWIEQSDGRTGRHPIDGYYFAPDDAFVGKWIVSDFVLEEFRQGAKLSLTSPTGATIAEFGMKGTGKARGHFKQACKI
jgi:hypothetical protein